MEKNYQDRRKDQRIDYTQAIYVEVVQHGSRSEADNTILRCETVDISAGGLRLWVPQDIAPGSTLHIAVPLQDWKENLELTGKAMWSKAADDKEGYWLGLELETSSRGDMEEWFKVVHRLKK